MNQNEIIEVIDCSPTWQALLLPMLDLYRNAKKIDNIKALEQEFKTMAIAADKWNEHCKSGK